MVAAALEQTYFGVTPYEVVMQHRKMSVLHFRSVREYSKPLLLMFKVSLVA